MPSDSRIYSEKQYQIYEQSSKFRPFNIETLYNKALSHMHLSELDEVDWCYVEILKMYPIIAGAIAEKETIQLEKGNYKQAVIFFDKALKIELKNIRIIRNKALALEPIGDQASAEKIQSVYGLGALIPVGSAQFFWSSESNTYCSLFW